MYQDGGGLLPNGNPFVQYEPNMQIEQMNLLNNSDGNTSGGLGSIV